MTKCTWVTTNLWLSWSSFEWNWPPWKWYFLGNFEISSTLRQLRTQPRDRGRECLTQPVPSLSLSLSFFLFWIPFISFFVASSVQCCEMQSLCAAIGCQMFCKRFIFICIVVIVITGFYDLDMSIHGTIRFPENWIIFSDFFSSTSMSVNYLIIK